MQEDSGLRAKLMTETISSFQRNLKTVFDSESIDTKKDIIH